MEWRRKHHGRTGQELSRVHGEARLAQLSWFENGGSEQARERESVQPSMSEEGGSDRPIDELWLRTNERRRVILRRSFYFRIIYEI